MTGFPSIREELRLHGGAPERDGSPTWIIHDPPANRFFRIGWLEFEILSRWDLPADDILQQITADTTLRPTTADLERVGRFLQGNNLLSDPTPGGVARLGWAARQRDTTFGTWLIHNYLFFRIPLLRPDRFLERIYPYAAPFLSLPSVVAVVILGLLGLFLAARQWDVFVSTFVNTFTPAGILGYILALVAAKCFHELGHALLAKRYGVRIPRMGIAFLVMFPVLYTDTNESWFITDNRKRLLVSAGGIIAEGALAAVSLFCWGLTAEGPVREAFYFVAVASLFRSLLVNSSPFLRFDGYYLLSDYLDLPNLQQRAFALTRHYIRRFIFGPGEPPPEVFPTRRTVFLVAYSLATWLYRLVVFLGIAFAVYRFFFKPLGILLMMVEIWFFILLPVVREGIVWRKEIAHLSGKRRYVLALSGLLVLMLLCIPFRTTVRMPAYLTAGEKRQIFAPFSARLEQAVKGGVVVHKGDLLFKLTADEAVYQAALADRQASELHDRIRRFSLSDGGKDQVAAWSAEARERELASAAQRAELRRLSVRADFNGVVLDVDDGIVPGVSVSQNEMLGILVNPSSSVIEAVASEDELSRVRIGGKAVFVPSAPDGRPVDGVLVALDQNRIGELPTPALADRHGGEIATRHDSDRRLTPAASLYRVRIRPVGAATVTRLQIGYALVEAERRSVAGRFFRQAVSVLIRESGF